MVAADEIDNWIANYRRNANIVRSFRVLRYDYIAYFQFALLYFPCGSCGLHVVHVGAENAVVVYVGVIAKPDCLFAQYCLLVDATESQIDDVG